MVLQNWIIDCHKMCNSSGEVKKFIENTMENQSVELTTGVKSLTEVKIQRGIFQGDALSPLLYLIAMIRLNHIFRKCAGGYTFMDCKKKTIHLIYMDDTKLFAKNEKELESQQTYHIISARRPELVIAKKKKKNLPNSRL